MSERNLELDLHLSPPEVSPEQVEQLINVLVADLHWLPEDRRSKAAGWMTAAQIATQIEGIDERQVRRVAKAAAPAVVSYPGSPGYKLWGACTVEEINHAIAAFEAQAADMTMRANLYRRAYHRRFQGSS